MSTPTTATPASGTPTESKIALAAVIDNALADNELSVTEFEDIILEMQKDGLMDKEELVKLATLKTKAMADNPDTSSKARITSAYVSAIPIEEARKMIKDEAFKWILVVIILFISWLFSYLAKLLP